MEADYGDLWEKRYQHRVKRARYCSFTPYPENFNEMVLKDIRCRSEIVRGIDLEEITFNSYSNFLRQMISITSIEAGSRFEIDQVLQDLSMSALVVDGGGLW
jgi:hypothetical protein